MEIIIDMVKHLPKFDNIFPFGSFTSVYLVYVWTFFSLSLKTKNKFYERKKCNDHTKLLFQLSVLLLTETNMRTFEEKK